MKKLGILVPQYKETDEVVKPLLDSIAVQQNVDFDDIEVIIVNDGTDVHLSEKLLTSYPFEVKYILAEHGGVSAARNRCLDETKAEYVMWCDADDMFYTATAFWVLFQEMEHSHFDSLTSAFIEEGRHPQTKQPFYMVRGAVETGGVDSTFVHGKVHRRQYLINNNIRWNNDLTIHEDSYFNCLCQKLSKNVVYCPTPFYLWKWRDDSVCRRDPKYILKTMPNMLASNTALVEQFLSRHMEDEAKFYATSMIMDCYYQINCKQWMDSENAEFKEGLEKCFKEYYVKYKHLYESIDEKVKYQIVAGIRNRFFQEGLLLESITFDQWIAHIMEL